MAWSGPAEVPQQVLFVSILFGAGAAAFGVLGGVCMWLAGIGSEISLLVGLFSVWILLATTSSSQKGILIWQSKIRASAWCEISGELSGLAVALIALVSGYGILALVFGRIAMQSVHVTLSFVFTKRRPLRGMTSEQLRDLRNFSIPLFSSRMIANIRIYAATFIIGGFLGAAAVGYYRAAERLVGALAEVIAVPAQIFSWSLFRKSREKHNGTLSGFQVQANVYFHVLMLTALPVFVWVAVFAGELIVGLIGAEWLPAVPVVIILALAQAAKVPSLATEAVLSIAGEIKRMPKYSVVFLVTTIVLTLIASPFGMLAVAWAQVVGTLFVTILLLWLTGRFGEIHWAPVARYCRNIALPMVFASVTLIQLRSHLLQFELHVLVLILLASVPAILVYAICLLCFDPPTRQAAKNLLEDRITATDK